MSRARLFLVAPIVVFALVAVLFGFGLTRDPSRIPSELIDRPLPTFALPGVDGSEEGLASTDFTGEVALLNVFGSWCSGCVVEHPTLVAIAEQTDTPIYGLAWKDAPGAAARWLARRGDPYRKVGDDPDSRVAVDLGVTGAPETFVIDRDGRVRYKHVGPVTPEVWRDTLAPIVAELEGS